MNKQHTYREFLALLPSRPHHSHRKQKYANRLTNYESYNRSPIKRWTHKYTVILHDDYDDSDESGDDDDDDDYDDGDESVDSDDEDDVMLNSQPRKIQKLN